MTDEVIGLSPELQEEFNTAVQECFQEVCELNGVANFGVCGIDVQNPVELLKVAAAIKVAASAN